jgi:hypothetical protein
MNRGRARCGARARSNRRFEGFTEDGERVVDVAHRMLAGADVLVSGYEQSQNR